MEVDFSKLFWEEKNKDSGGNGLDSLQKREQNGPKTSKCKIKKQEENGSLKMPSKCLQKNV